MNVSELRSQLSALLASELGRYPNNQLSIWVFGSSSNPPSSSNGLECLIKEVPGGYAKRSSGGQKFKPQEWEIVLKNYSPSSKLATAIAKIEKRFTVTSCRHTPSTTDAIEQARIFIYDPIGVNT
jgi:hypothetical protein